MSLELPENPYPNEVVVPFANPISSMFKVFACDSDPNAGGGRHRYKIVATNDKGDEAVFFIGFQKGALPETSFNGILSNVLVAVLIDHLRSYQEGQFKSRETALMITHLEEVEHWMARRADDRKTRGVLGAHAK